MTIPIYQHPVDPATYDASDGFGTVRADTGRPHLGSDYAVPEGTPVRSISDGQVVFVGWTDVLGWVVGVYHWDGFWLGYAHLRTTVAHVGQLVPRGTDLGYSGNTGSASKGAHLHVSCGTTVGAIWGEGFGSTLVDPFARIESLLTAPASSTEQEELPMPLTDYERNMIRREARGRRLFVNRITGQAAAADLSTGYFRRNEPKPGATTEELDRQLERWEGPYGITGPSESRSPRFVDPKEWANLIHEVNLYRREAGFAVLVEDWEPTPSELARASKITGGTWLQ